MSNGIFITFEGGDGSGKSTQVKLLGEKLAELNVPHLVTREVGGTDGAEQLRNLLFQRDAEDWDYLSEVLMIQAARREHLTKKIWPALKEGSWVISDRFIDSTRVFQGYGRELGLPEIDASYQMIADGFEPHLTLIFDIPVDIGLERSMKHMEGSEGLEATEDKFELLGTEFQEKIRQGYLDIAAQYPERCVIIDATGTIEEIHDEVMNIVQTRFDVKNGSNRTAANGN